MVKNLRISKKNNIIVGFNIFTESQWKNNKFYVFVAKKNFFFFLLLFVF